jgi:hypothetical protein
LVERAGAGAEARCCFERCLLSHDVELISSCAAGDYCTQYGEAEIASRRRVVKKLFGKPRDDFFTLKTTR